MSMEANPLKVFVIKTTRLEEVLIFYQSLGLEFVEEQHGSGPKHFACERNGVVFEIYPAKEADKLLYM